MYVVLKKNQHEQYLKDVLDENYLDMIHDGGMDFKHK